MPREKDLRLEGAIVIGCAVELMDNKLTSMSLSNPMPERGRASMYSDQDGDLPVGHPSPATHLHSHREAQRTASTVAHGARPVWKVMSPVWHH